MKPLNQYLLKNFERATLEQLADEYRKKGFTVKREVIIGPYRVDLVASKGDENVYVELKTHRESPDAKRRIKEMADFFKKIPNAKFIVVVSRIPEFKKIEFDDIEQILTDYFILNFPSVLDELSTHTMIDEVYDVSISEIIIQNGELDIECTGMVGVTLQYGSDSDQELGDEPMYMSFPFKFKGVIGYDGKNYNVEDSNELEIDTDAYYE